MPIDTNILMAYGAAVSKLKKNTIIFSQDEMARFYFQILEGQVKTFNLGPNQKEFVQGMFNDGESFGEPPLFIGEPYSANAVTTKDTILVKISQDIFFTILHEHPEIQMAILNMFAQKLYDKSVSARMLNQLSPEQRILDFLLYYKKKSSKSAEKIHIPYTRKELANLTGLRIETVIRTLRKLKEAEKLDIVNHKVYF
jgi:CRP-like cAMP-binding protein